MSHRSCLSRYFILFAFFFLTSVLKAQTFLPKTVNVSSQCHGYWEYLPINYNSTTTKYPLIIYIPGAGGYGNGSASSLNPILNESLPYYINQNQFPATFPLNGGVTSFIVIAPQFFSLATPVQVKQVIDYMVSHYRVDMERIYLTGFSMGGVMAWRAPYNLANATRLAALAPMAGYNNPYSDTTAQFIAGAGLPVWAIHSANDNSINVSASVNMVNKINSFNPPVPALMTILNGPSHEQTHLIVYNPTYRPNGKSLYEWFLQYARNYPPVANAGNNISITQPVNQVNLNGSGSSDPENGSLLYNWSKIAGPSQFTIGNSTSATTPVTNLVAGVYRFQLMVTDIAGLTARDTVQVTVINPNPNQLPVAAAGNDQSIELPQTSVNLNGNNSFDPNGIIESYSWTKISGPAQFTITSPSSAITSVTDLRAGIYQFRLTVTDNEGGTASDVISITVINPFPNVIPISNAGSDQSITLPVNTAALNGAGSTDPDGVITAYQWNQVAGPSTAVITTPNAITTNVNNLVLGNYQFELLVTDDSSAVDRDTISVIVNPAPVITQKFLKVNLYGGSFPAGTGWNNWNVQSNLSLNNILYSDGSSSTVTATLNLSNAIADNGTGYPVTMCPVEVGRTTSYSTVGRLITISGLNNTKKYNLEVYASRKGTGNSTKFTVSGTAITILTDNNYTNKAVFSNLSPVSGQIRLNIDRINTYNYINGFMLTEILSGGTNTAPVAVPGTSQTITLPLSQITLNGSGSYDPDGSISSYSWQRLSGPGTVTIASPATATTSVTGLTQGTHLFQLTVTDNLGASGANNVQVIVNAQGPPPPPVGQDSLNCGKVFKIVVLGSSTALGTGSNPIDSAWVNKLRFYVRSKNTQSQVINLALSGFTTYHALCPTGYNPPANRPAPDTARNITKALTHNPDLIIINLPSNDAAGNYTVQEQQANYERTMNLANALNIPVWVTTTQPRNNMSASQMNSLTTMRDWIHQRFGVKAIDFWTTVANADGTINSVYNSDGTHVNNAGHLLFYSRAVSERLLDTLCLRKNIKPNANAGNNISILLPVDSTQLNGAGSNDPDGMIVTYNWTRISGPTQYTISNSAIANPKLTGLVVGTYQFQLTVIDNYGASGRDTVQITVGTSVPQPPISNAGIDIVVFLPTDSVQLNGAGSVDTDGTITGYQWNRISGPTQYTITDSTIVNPKIKNLTTGNYLFELKVTDNSGLTDRDSILIIVNPVPNQVPVSNAGPDTTISFPGNSTQLDGSLSYDTDGSVVTYRWARITGPASFSIDDSTVVNPIISNLSPGTYTVQLTVTDNEGAIDRDSVRIVVDPPPNQIPVANAGIDASIVLPVSSKQLNGSASFDPDGTITYSWLKISGPVPFSINNASAINPVISNLVAGVYTLQLTVTDNNGAIDRDTTIITVYPPLNTLPVSNAGADQSITLPVNSVTLNGSGSTDPGGVITTYQWSQVAGPSTAVISTPNSITTNINNLVLGSYQFALMVTDDSSSVDRDTVLITVNPAPTTTQKFLRVNIYGGSFPAGTGWNNWNVQSNLSLNNILYSDGTSSTATATLNLSNAIADNGTGYPVTMCPLEVGRTTSYSTVARLITISGLNNTKKYNLEVYGSRKGTGNSTKYTVSGTSINILTDNNYSNKAVFNNLTPVSGQIKLSIERLNTYNYINGFILTEITNSAGRTSVDPEYTTEEPDFEIVPDVMKQPFLKVRTDLSISPNPFTDQLQLQIKNKHIGRMTMKLIDQYGTVVKIFQFMKDEEYFSQHIRIQKLSPGIYFLQVQVGNWLQTEKLVKIN